MTALPQYVRLESSGTWRESATEQARDVIVCFGDATVVISDTRTDLPLTHWSLAALVRRNPGAMPAIYGPLGDNDETLEIDDAAMVTAIEKVLSAIEAGRPHPGRLRGALTVLIMIGIMVGVAMWLPQKLVRQATGSATDATRQQVGREILSDMSPKTGRVCHSDGADAAIEALQDRLPGQGLEIAVVPGDVPNGAMMLPGNVVMVSNATLKGPDTPDALAGAVVAAEATAQMTDPFQAFMQWAGPKVALRMLISGEIPAEAMIGYGQLLLREPPEMPPQDVLLKAFTRANIASSAYAGVVDPQGTRLAELISNDPFREKAAPVAVLREAPWAALKKICN